MARPIRNSIWTVYDTVAKTLYENIQLIVSGDDPEEIKQNEFYLTKLYNKVYKGRTIKQKAFDEKRLEIKMLILEEKIVGYSNVN